MYSFFDSMRYILTEPRGVGASCIYGLLGTASRPNWRFFGTELDEKNFDFAQRNVEGNNLSNRIKLLRTSALDRLLPLDKLCSPSTTIDFTMCNPPFYSSEQDMQSSTWTKAAPPSAVCTGAPVEMITEGGDAGFVSRMADESKEMAGRVRWYTSMFGKLDSVLVVVERLKKLGCRNWALGTLFTGSPTRRWVLAWSWGDWRPSNVSNWMLSHCDFDSNRAATGNRPRSCFDQGNLTISNGVCHPAT
jgi:23S rRNA (adenine1618-N6)-methyltransferase